MGFQITALTPIPLNPDGTQDEWTWGEAGGPYTVPAAESAGFGAEVLDDNDVNYEWQHGARWTRAMRDRVVFSDEGLLASCVVKQGAWNIGGGTLDVTLTPTRLVVDVNDDGGTVLEIKAPLASPETLAASSDSYLDLDESGGYTIAAVPNGNPEPAITPGHVRVFKLVTDGVELTSVSLAQGVAPFPCFGPVVGAVDLQAVAATVSTLSSSIVTRKTHDATGGWEDGFAPSWRTFTVAGTLDGVATPIDVPITSASPDDARQLFTGIPANCVVSFALDLTSAVGTPGDNMSVATLLDVISASGKITLTREAGVYAEINSTILVDTDVTPFTVTAINVAGETSLRLTFDGALALSPYRVTIEAKISLVTLNP